MLLPAQARETRGSKQLEVLLQAIKGEGSLLDLNFEIVGDGGFFILSGGNVKGFDHHPSSTINIKVSLHLLPQLSPVVIGQQLLLPGAIDEGPRFTPEASYHMAVVDTASSADFGRTMHA